MISCLRCAQLYRLLISLCLTFSFFTILSFFFNDLLTQTSVLILLCCRTIWLMDHRVYLLRLASMTPHKMMHHRATLVWQMPTNFSLRFLLILMLFSGGSLYVELFCFWVSSQVELLLCQDVRNMWPQGSWRLRTLVLAKCFATW